MEHKQYRKAEDPTVYTYLKFHVQGKKHDGVCHVEYADNNLLYVIVQVPRTGAVMPCAMLPVHHLGPVPATTLE